MYLLSCLLVEPLLLLWIPHNLYMQTDRQTDRRQTWWSVQMAPTQTCMCIVHRHTHMHMCIHTQTHTFFDPGLSSGRCTPFLGKRFRKKCITPPLACTECTVEAGRAALPQLQGTLCITYCFRRVFALSWVLILILSLAKISFLEVLIARG